MVQNLKSVPNLVILTLMGIGLIAVLSGYGLEERHLLYSARILSQSGIPNPKNLEKLRLLPATLKLAGFEAFLTAALAVCLRRGFCGKVNRIVRESTSRRVFLLLLFCLYLLITFLMLNFGTVGLYKRVRFMSRMSNQEIVAADYGEDYLLVLTLKTQTPQDANILIQTKNDIKYLLNYDLYPRRFFFYPESEIPVVDIPEAWKDRYRISWILQIDDHDPRKFILMKRKA